MPTPISRDFPSDTRLIDLRRERSDAPAPAHDTRTVVFIDARVPGLDTMLRSSTPGTLLVVLDSGSDGVAQIAQILQAYRGLDSIQIISHGAAGQVALGSTTLSAVTVAQHASALALWGAALGAQGDLLLYGCNVGAGSAGAAFIDAIGTAVGADVAASTGLTGSAILGGDWELERQHGAIESSLALDNDAVQGWQTLLGVNASFTGDTGNTPSTNATVANGSQSQVTIAHLSSGETLTISGSSAGLYLDSVETLSAIKNLVGTFSGNAVLIDAGGTLLSSGTLTLASGKPFSLNSFDFQDTVGQQILVLTAGAHTFTLDMSANSTDDVTTVDLSANADFQNITSVTITSTTNGNVWAGAFDNFVLTNIPAPAPTITSATYDASTGVLSVTGTDFLALAGTANDIDLSKLSITGEGGLAYTLTNATTDVEIASATAFTVTLGSADRSGVNLLVNKNLLSSTTGTTYNLAAAEDWARGAASGDVVADLTGNAVTASNVAIPTITTSTYDLATGILVVTGTDLVRRSGPDNDINVSKLTFKGEGSTSTTYTLTTASVDVTSPSSFTVTLNSADRDRVAFIANQNGTTSVTGTSYKLSGLEDWAAGADAALTVIDTTGNGVTVSNVAAPTITSAAYNPGTGVMVVTGTGIQLKSGSSNDINVHQLSIVGEGGSAYALSNTNSIDATSSTSFTVTLHSSDKAAVNLLLNNAGNSSTGGTTYNLVANEDWDDGAVAGTTIADLTGNAITVGAVAVPAISSAAYNAGTGVLSVAGTDFLSLGGANNDINVSKLRLWGEDGQAHLLTSGSVDITSGTAFTVTLSAADRGAVNLFMNKAGTSATSGSTYNLSAAEDWAAGAGAGVTDADLNNVITVSNVAAPSIDSAAYDAASGVLTVTGSNLSTLYDSSSNDIDVTRLSITGDSTPYTLTSSDVDVNSTTSFTVILNNDDRSALELRLNQNGTASSGGATYNLAAGEDWARGADAAVTIADATGNGITVSNMTVMEISGASYDAATGVLSATATGLTTGDVIKASKLTLVGEGSASYTLVGTPDGTASSGTAFALTLDATDRAAVNLFMNKAGASAQDGSAYNLSAADDWNGNVTAGDTSDASTAVTVAAVPAPAITSASYTSATGVLVVTGTDMNKKAGATNDIDATKLTLTGEGGATYTLTGNTNSVEVSNGTSFSITLGSNDRAAVNLLMNKAGTSATDGTSFNLAGAASWNAGSSLGAADLTGNAVTVGTLAAPTITSATYDYFNAPGLLVVTGTGLLSKSGTANDIDVSKLSILASGVTVALSSSSNVDVTSATSFTVSLSSTDQAALAPLTNQVGTRSSDGIKYILSGAEDWAAGADPAVTVADATNGLTVSNIARPTITSATWNEGTGVLAITGNRFVLKPGAANDVDVAKLTITGDATPYALTADTANVELASSTSILITLGSTDAAALSSRLNKEGTSSTGAVTYNLAAAEDWLAGSAGANINLVDADLNLNGITVIQPPTVTSISLVDASSNNLSSVQYTVAFSKAVTGVDTNDFSLTASGASGNIASVSGSGSTYTVTVDSVAGDGTLRLDLNASGTGIIDASSNALMGGYTAGSSYTVDHSSPAVLSVTAPSNSTYKVGDQLDFTVNFSEAVTVNSGGGTPSLAITLATGGTVQAQYVSGSGGTALAFRYVVASGDIDADGVALGSTIALNGGTLRDALGNNATLTLNGVASTGGVLVDGFAPVVSTINRMGAASTSAASVDFAVTFAESVSGVDTGDFSLGTTGGASGTISAISGSGADYIVTVSSLSGDGTLRLDLDTLGTGITDGAGNPIQAGFTSGQSYTLDHTAPVVSSVGVPSNATYQAGQTLEFSVNFSEAVTVTGTPRLAVTLDTGGTVYADYVSGSGGTALAFSHTVVNGEFDDNGVSLGASAALNGGTIKDGAGNAATLALNSVGALGGVLVDALGPNVSSISLVNPGSNNLASLQYTVVFSEPVTGVDTSDFSLTASGASGNIASVTGSGSSYTVTVDSVAGDGTLRLDLKGSGTGIIDGASNAITGGYTAGSSYTVDHSSPTVSSVSAPSSATYKAGDQLDFTVNFTEAVTVDSGGGTPSLAITLATGGTVQAQYVSGSGGTSLVFRYVVASGNVDADGVALGGTIALNGGTLRDALGNNATLTLNSVAGTGGVLVDGLAPVVSTIDRVGAASTSAGSVDYAITFAESVSGVDTSDFSLSATGSAAGSISAITGSGASYTVTVSSLTGDGTLRLDLNTSGTGIADAAGNAIQAGFTSGQSYTLDHTAPAVSSVGVPSNATYLAGQTLDFSVNFSEAVVVTGTPRLAVTLDTGGTVYANYVSGSGGTALAFSHTVVNGEFDGDGVSLGSSALLNGGTIKDGAGNDATLTLNSVGALGGVLVAALGPHVSSISLVNPGSNNLASLQYTVVFSSAVTGVDTGDFSLTASGASAQIASLSGSGTTYLVTLDTVAGDGSLRLDLNASGTGITDANSNPIVGGFTTGSSYLVDHSSPLVASVAAPASQTYKAGQAVDFVVNFNEAVTVNTGNGTPTLAVTLDGGGVEQASYVSGSGGTALTFRYQVANGNVDSDGVALASAIALNGATLTDAVGNNATLNLNGVASMSGVLVNGLLPQVVAIDRIGAAATNAVSVDYAVSFSDSVSGVDVSDFSLSAGGSATGTIAAISGSGASYTVTVNGLAGEGTLRLDLNATGTGITSSAGNAIDAGFAGGQSYTLDHVAPGATLTLSDLALTGGETAQVTVLFSEAVAGFNNGKVSVPSGSLSTFTTSDGGLTWQAILTPPVNVFAQGNVLSLSMAGITDAAGNAGSGTTLSASYAVNTVVVVPPVVEPPVVVPPVVVPPVVVPPVVEPPVVQPPVPPVVAPPVVGLPATPGSGTVDGVALETTIVTDPVTGLINAHVSVPVIGQTRSDDPASAFPDLADIPLGLPNASGERAADLTISLPAGAGVEVEGPTSLLNNGQAFTDLFNRINLLPENGLFQTMMQSLTGLFLNGAARDTLFQVMSVKPMFQDLGKLFSMRITGPASEQPAQNAHEVALVIDASDLPANAEIALNNVDFAIIVGAVTLRGGEGENFVIGDDAAQNILLGPDNDTLYGGGGNDIVGSAGGDDKLFGGTGNDKVAGGIGNDRLDGDAGNDILQGGRSDIGNWLFSLDRNGALQAQHQTALFAPGATETLSGADLNRAAPGLEFLGAAPARLVELAGLYQAAFGRVADLPGLAFWAGAGTGMGSIANSFLQSGEWTSKGALSDLAFMQKLYQQGLGRAPDAAGLQFWLDQLAHDGAAGRTAAMLSFSTSVELKNHISSAAGMAIGAASVTQESSWIAGSGDDRLDGGAGNDILVGGDGIDTVVYAGKLADYKILLDRDGQLRIADKASNDIDTLSGIERGAFSDGTVDLSLTQADTQALRTLGLMYQSVLDRPGDLEGLSGWLGRGLSVEQLALGFAGTAEFQARYTAMGNEQFVHALYQNTGYSVAASVEQAWVEFLGQHSRAELIAKWVESDGVALAQFGETGLWLV